MHKTIRSFSLLAVLLCSCSLGLQFDRAKIKAAADKDGGAHVDGGAGTGKDGGLDASGGMKDASADATTLDGALDSGQDAASGDDSGGPECSKASECGTASACKFYQCIASKCVTKLRSSGAVAMGVQVAGDCHVIQCDGSGGQSSVIDDTDVPNDSMQCTNDLCSVGVPSHTFVASTVSCTQDGGHNCDGAGACVACVTKTDCGTDTECRTWACTSNACVSTDTPANTVLTTGQAAGDCRELQCNGSGGTMNAIDNGDSDDGSDCTTDSCSAGTPSHTLKSDGVGCNQNGGHFCRSGLCKTCGITANCGTPPECQTYTCVGTGTCQTNDVANNTPASNAVQAAGDCQEVQCDGIGGMKTVTKTSDVPIVDDNNDCTSETCSGNTPHPAVADGLVCSQNGGGFCRSGVCATCGVNANCGTNTECETFACMGAGTCQTTEVPNNTPVSNSNQTTGDCKEVQCNGSGATKIVNDDTDLPPNDNNPCTMEACNNGVPHPPEPLDTVCNTTKFCDGNKNCVECNSDAQCSPGPLICIDNACIPTGSLTTTTPVTPLQAGASSAITINFTTTHKWANNGVLSVVFPLGYTISGATLGTVTGIAGSHTTSINGNEFLFTRTGGSTIAASAMSIHLTGVVNPHVSGSAGAIVVSTKTGAGVTIDTGSASAAVITTGALVATVTPALTTTGTATNVTVAATLANPWPLDGKLDITFDPTFDLTDASFGVAVTPNDGSFLFVVSGSKVTITRQADGADIPAGALTIVLSNVITPGSTGMTDDYAITTRTATGVAIDTGTATGTTIN